MDKLIQLVKLYIEEVTRQNSFIDFVIANLKGECSDVEKINEILTEMRNINSTQGERLKQSADPTKPAEVTDLSLQVLESSLYLSKASTIISSMFPEKNSFVEIINKIKKHSDYVHGLMDDLLRTYLVNIPDELLQGYIDNVSEEEIDKVVESLNRMIALKPEDNYAKELVEKLIKRKVELMAATPNESIDDSSIGQMSR